MSYLGLMPEDSSFVRRDATSYATEHRRWDIGSDDLAFKNIYAESFITKGEGAIVVPVGTTSQRPSPDLTGMVRYNTDTKSFEGRNDSGDWVNLGAAKDIDGDTFITAEDTAGADNDQIKFYTAGGTTPRMYVDSTGHLVPGVTGAYDLGTNTSRWRSIYVNDIISDSGITLTSSPTNTSQVGNLGFNDARYVLVAGDTMSGTLSTRALIPVTTSAYNLGTVTKRFNDTYLTNIDVENCMVNSGTTTTIYNDWNLAAGATLEATYADIAEKYELDGPAEPGDVLVIGGEADATLTTTPYDHRVLGVISTAPAYKLNSEAGPDDTHPYIALAGRVPCKVIGPVNKGDTLVTSHLKGVAKAGDFSTYKHPGCVVGKALESWNGEGVKKIEIKV